MFQKIFNFIKKSSATSILHNPTAGYISYSNFNTEKMQKEGYEQNVVVYRCVDMIAKEVAKVPFVLFSNEKKIEKHPLLSLLDNPNPMQSKSEYFIDVISQKLITGNAYLETAYPDKGLDIRPTKTPVYLYSLNPTNMKILKGRNNIPSGYEFSLGGQSMVFPVGISGESNILHLKTFNPLSKWEGMSPIQSAAYNIDQLNLSNQWNNNILKNSGNVSGIIETGELTPEQVSMFKEQLESFKGSSSKSLMTLPTGVKYQQMGLTPGDLNFAEGIKMSSQMIAFAFGVPYDLVNTDQAKYENLDKAKELLWDNAVKPHLEHIITEFNTWLVPRYGKGLKLGYDEDSVEAISTKRDRKRQSLEASSFMTINEKRLAMGLNKLDGADTLLTEMNKIPLDQAGFGDEIADDEKSYTQSLIQKGYDAQMAEKITRLVYDHSD
mgnify:CR=1 FL=1